MEKDKIIEVLTSKLNILNNCSKEISTIIEKINNGMTISEIASEITDENGRETFWFDAYFKENNVELNPLDFKAGQLCIQVDEEGHWF